MAENRPKLHLSGIKVRVTILEVRYLGWEIEVEISRQYLFSNEVSDKVLVPLGFFPVQPASNQ